MRIFCAIRHADGSRIVSIESFLVEKGLAHLDILHADVQGFELEVLRGATKTLAQTRAVLLEASFQNFYQGQCRFDELVSWLAGAGLHVRAFGHGTALGRPLVQSDVLFSRTY